MYLKGLQNSSSMRVKGSIELPQKLFVCLKTVVLHRCPLCVIYGCKKAQRQ